MIDHPFPSTAQELGDRLRHLCLDWFVATYEQVVASVTHVDASSAVVSEPSDFSRVSVPRYGVDDDVPILVVPFRVL
jgi:hypothetical protein